jgi:nucleotide-binding universal stress UspA family protein
MSRAPIRRIVVGVDGSGGSARALDWAIGLAAAVDAEVIAVHAHELPAYLPRPGGAPYVPELENWERAARQEFELRWCAPLAAAGVRHRTIFQIGRAGELLLSEADRVAADLVVTGRRGRGELVELLAGSVSQRMVHRARCPVVVIPAEEEAAAVQVASATG